MSTPPRQPWLHELAICVDGNATALSLPTGDITGAGAEGLIVDDVRVLSVLMVRIGGQPPIRLAHSSSGAVCEFLGSARHLGNPGPDPTVEVHRRRELRAGGLTETITVTSRAAAPVETTVSIGVGGDGADLPDLKAGTAGERVAGITLGAHGPFWNTPRHVTSVRVDPAPPAWRTALGSHATADIPVALQPGTAVTVTVHVEVTRTTASSFDADPGLAAVDWSGSVRVRADDPRLATAVGHALADLEHLLLTDPLAPDDIAAAAGTPWYLTLFGRDSIWTARMALPLGTRLAAGTLRALARRQGKRHDRTVAEEPGKIPHEIRRMAYTAGEGVTTLAQVHYGTIDATPLWICLLHDAWRWGMPDGEARALLPHLRAALGWLRSATDRSPDGLLRYVGEGDLGPANQGWKDSFDSVRWRDGRIAQAPIALLEAQAYTVEAAAASASLLRRLGTPGDAALADAASTLARDMAERIRRHFWVGGSTDRWLGIAVDGRGHTVDGLASNMGHVLGTGSLTSTEAASVVRTLTQPRMLGRYGLATLAKDNGGYNPIGYHTGSIWIHDTAIAALGMIRERHAEAAAVVIRSMLAATEAFGYRCPELHADVGVLDQPAPYPASCRPQAWSAAATVALLTVALGIDVDVPGRTVQLLPARPAPFGALRVEGLRIADSPVTVAVDRDGHVSIDGLPDGFALVRPGHIPVQRRAAQAEVPPEAPH